MNMLAMTLQNLGQSPAAWGVVGVLVLIALYSVWRFRRCPQLCEDVDAGDRSAAEAYLASRIAEGPGYFLLMLAGIGALIAGLAMIAGDMRPELGFFIMIAGVVVVQTEPLRQRIRIATARLAAAPDSDAELQDVARANLRDSHRSLVFMNFALAIAVALGLLAF